MADRKTTKVQFYVSNELYEQLKAQAKAKEVRIGTLCKLAIVTELTEGKETN
ncbi:hypothetical protein GNE06_00340 [Trichormus variabilis 9RC]|nr:hypothetical protein [Trichormus variabilis 9RC]